MAVFATDADLETIIPDIFNHGMDTFTGELDRGSSDVARRIKTEWWNVDNDPEQYDPDLLNASEWRMTTVYYTLAYYILPLLSNFQEDDTFQRQMLFYKERYQEEFLAAAAAGISYDRNDDGVYATSEIDYVDAGRLVR
jgi:hypothetical protein